ncbi:MAG: rhomboid family intramembrane serine protease [Proteobacteria bacterium]|jgi:membrane associated rhomboid family serine protease|nr:rhomboid family intramembrane serine protease [Pseudomonadota bacterium]
MSVVFRIGEEEPLFHLGEFPVRLITLLVALHSVAMIAVSILLATGHRAFIDLLTYSSEAVAHGQIWRLVTYAFVAAPSVWFLLEMLMLWYFGKEVENGLGWKRFAILYAGLILIGPMLLQGFGYAGRPQTYAGAQEINFAIFAAFTAMHPGARFFFGVAARWVFLGLLAISVLQLLADQQLAKIVVLIGTSSLAVLLLRKAGFSDPLLENFTWRIPWKKSTPAGFSVQNGGLSAASRGSKGVAASQTPQDSFDPEKQLDILLEKIARKGIGSLDASERDALEKARRAMIRREGGR